MSTLPGLISSVSTLSAVTSRKVSALVGSVVGDAASLHLEWIYDQDKLEKIVVDKDPEFWPESHCPFFTLPNGKVSCYADEALTALNVTAGNGGTYDVDKVTNSFLKYFGNEESPYQIALAKRKDNLPVPGPWIQGNILSMITNYQEGLRPPGPDDSIDHDGLVVAMPLICQQPNADFETVIKPAVTIMTTEPNIVNHTEVEAAIISGYILHGNNEDAVANAMGKFANKYKEIVHEMKMVQEDKLAGEETKTLVKKFGMACPLPGNFQSALVSIMGATSYESAIRETMKCGGDCCSRSNFIGACLGARFGIEGIPQEWMAKVDGIENIIEKAIVVMNKTT